MGRYLYENCFTGKVTIHFHIRAGEDINPAEMLGAILIVDHEHPWVGPAGLERFGPLEEPKKGRWEEDILYAIDITHKGVELDRVEAFLEYAKRLAENAPKHMTSGHLVMRTTVQVTFISPMTTLDNVALATT